ncbi:MAG: OmpA family protein [Novosphingobium sp.]
MRNFLIILLLAAVAACATVPRKAGFSKAQVAAMTELGFKPVSTNYELGLEDRVLFAVDQSDLSPEASAVLGRIATALTAVNIRGASVVGHTDSTGSSEYNLSLSQRRAASVKGGLSAAGMDAARIRDQGMGETQPVASNDTDAGRAQNRRVVIIVSPEDAN